MPYWSGEKCKYILKVKALHLEEEPKNREWPQLLLKDTRMNHLQVTRFHVFD